MPTAGELRLEQAHQRDLATISAGVMSGVANIALGADPAAISTWFFTALDAITARVQVGYAQARRSGTGYVQSRATMAGADVDIRAGSLNLTQARTSLEVTGPVAFKRAVAAGADDEEALLSMATQMSGSAQRLAIAGDRDVLEQTIAHGKGVVGYRRVLGGPGCGFCAMLASRGAVYLSRESASMTRSGLRFHDHCRCSVSPLFDHEPDPPDVQRLQRQWQRVTAGQTGKGKATAWRNYWENDLVDRSKLRLAAAKAGPPSPVPRAPTPAPGVVVRSGLDAKKTLTGLQEAWSAEAKRITGRILDVDIPAGTSLQTAKEYAEGVLRGLERFPDASLQRIRFGQMAADQYAEAGMGEMTFNAGWANMANRPALVSGMQNDIAGWAQGRNGWSTRGDGTPMALSLHEFAHVLDIDNLGEAIHSRALTLATRRAALEGIPVDDLIARDISVYATSSEHELIAESFTDVMLRGQAASPLAREIFDLLEAEYFKAGGRITPAFGTFPAKAAPNLAKMTVPQLRALAAERGVVLPPRALKADIVRALEEAGPPAPRIVAQPDAARWLGNVDLTSMTTAEAERMGALVQAKSRRDILDEIVQLRADGASNRALVNRITGRSKLPNDFGVQPQVDDAFRDELLAAVDNGTIDDVVRRHLAALDVKPPAANFDAAIEAAAKGQSALDAVPINAASRGNYESLALDRYRVAPLPNEVLRGERVANQQLTADIRDLDEAFDRSRLTHDVELWRSAGRSDLGDPAAWAADLTGTEWLEDAYSSATASRRVADKFMADGGVRMRILAPKGSKAIRLSDMPGSGYIDPASEAEVLLARGARYRVVADRGWREIEHPTKHVTVRVRDIDVEVAVPGKTPPLPRRGTVAPVVEKPLAKRTVAELRALAKEREITLPPKATKAQIVEALQAPPLSAAEKAAAEKKALREAARERNRQIEQATGTARLLAEVDELLVKKAEARVIRQRLDPALIDPAQVFANADPAVREALAAALASGDMAKVRAAVTRLTTKAKLKVVGGKAGAKVKFDPDTMESLGAELADGAPVTVVTRGASVTLPDGTVVQVRKAQVVAVPPKAVPPTYRSRQAPRLKTLLSQSDDDAMRAAAQAIDGEYAGGIRAKVDGASVTDEVGFSQIVVTGDLLDAKTGQKIGNFSRAVLKDGRKPWVAEHETLEILPAYQGSGFANDFNANLYDWYRRSGIKRVELYANIDVGSYAWATKGFEFESAAVLDDVIREAGKKALGLAGQARKTLLGPQPGLTASEFAARYPGWTQAEFKAQIPLFDDISRRVRSGEQITAYEFSQLGRKRGQGKNDWWIGKVLLMGKPTDLATHWTDLGIGWNGFMLL